MSVETAGKWFKLGGKSSAFWDPTQPDPDSQFIGPNEVKKLVINDKVTQWKNRGGLLPLTDEEAKAEMTAAQKKRESAEGKASDKLNSAAEKEENAKAILREAEIKEKSIKLVRDENDTLKSERETLIARNRELEDAITASGAKVGGTPDQDKGGKKP